MRSDFQAKKQNTHGEHELELAANQAEPENQAGLVPGLDPEPRKLEFLEPKKILKFFFSKNQIRNYA